MDDAIITVTIPSGGSLSPAVYLGTKTLVGVETPAAWTAADLTLQAASTDGGTFKNVYDKAGNEYTIDAAASRATALDKNDLYGIGRWIKVRSGTAGTPVNQAADRELTLILKE